jgi:hypothetical protein
LRNIYGCPVFNKQEIKLNNENYDSRNFDLVGLSSVYEIFIKYHNYVVNNLIEEHGGKWNDDKIFFNARKRVIAMLQKIFYEGIYYVLFYGPLKFIVFFFLKLLICIFFLPKRCQMYDLKTQFFC